MPRIPDESFKGTGKKAAKQQELRSFKVEYPHLSSSDGHGEKKVCQQKVTQNDVSLQITKQMSK